MSEASSQQWLQARCELPAEKLEAAERVLWQLGAVSVSIEDAGQQDLLEPLPGEMPLWQQNRLLALFPAEHSEQLWQTLQQQLPILGATRLSLQALTEQNWERAWMAHFDACCFAGRLWICPSHKPAPPQARTKLMLDPGLAFGTGGHPTTALCLEWLAERRLNNQTVIDYGCGSGILGLAAAKLGARQVYAVDIDPQAVTATHVNAEKNQLSMQVQAGLPGQLTLPIADILIANILSRILIELKTVLSTQVRPGGLIALTGILETQVADVMAAYADHFTFAPPQQQQAWVLLYGERRPY